MDRRVSLAGLDSYDPAEAKRAVKRLLAPFGGAAALLAKGQRVLIKPNLLMSSDPARAVTTHPVIIEALAAELIEAGAEITLADSPGGAYNEGALNRVYGACGMSSLSSILKLNYDTSRRDVKEPEYFGGKKVPVISPVFEADLVISAAKLKTHMLTGITCGVKNLFGVIPGPSKAGYHASLPNVNDFAAFLVDIAEFVKPGFTLIDGVDGMEGNGPSGGTVKSAGVLIGSLNPHAADLAASAVMGFDARKLPTLSVAMNRGLMPRSADQLEMLGDRLEAHLNSFEPAPNYKNSELGFGRTPGFIDRFIHSINKNYPIITQKCVGCGDCAKNCPQKIIEIKEGRAVIDHKNCICCYCCQELCPVNAVTVERKG